MILFIWNIQNKKPQGQKICYQLIKAGVGKLGTDKGTGFLSGVTKMFILAVVMGEHLNKPKRKSEKNVFICNCRYNSHFFGIPLIIKFYTFISWRDWYPWTGFRKPYEFFFKLHAKLCMSAGCLAVGTVKLPSFHQIIKSINESNCF